MKHLPLSSVISLTLLASCDGAFAPLTHRPKTTEAGAIIAAKTHHRVASSAAAVLGEEDTTKARFLESLDIPYDLNARSETRTQLLNDVIDDRRGDGVPNPGRDFASVAPGAWRVCYAPHMTIMAGLFRGEFSVQYDLKGDGTIISHARYKFPLFNLFGYLSTSGTYGSVNKDVCRVDFDEAWMRSFDDDDSFGQPYPNIASVPNSIAKSLIRNIGRALFIEPFAVFPVSYLDDELIVFDFELLGTRICARKES